MPWKLNIREENSRRISLYETLKHDGSLPIVGVNTFWIQRLYRLIMFRPRQSFGGPPWRKKPTVAKYYRISKQHQSQSEVELVALKEAALNGKIFSRL